MCSQIGSDVSRYDSLLHSQHDEEQHSHIAELESQLMKRDVTIDDLSRKLQLSVEDYAARKGWTMQE